MLFSNNNSVYVWHALWVVMNKTTKICKNIFEFCILKKAKDCKTVSRGGFFDPEVAMVGERSRREPSGEVEN